MRCFEFRQNTERFLREDGTLKDEDGSIAAHLRECPLCREHYSDLLLTRALREEPVPPPDEDFSRRVLDRAVGRGGWGFWNRRLAGLSAAAVVLAILAVGFLLDFGALNIPGSGRQPIEVALTEGKEDSISILIEAKKARRNAVFTVDLEGKVALKDLPGRRKVTWRTDLAQGRNLLELPLELKDESGGRIRVGYRYDNTEKEVRVRVKPVG